MSLCDPKDNSGKEEWFDELERLANEHRATKSEGMNEGEVQKLKDAATEVRRRAEAKHASWKEGGRSEWISGIKEQGTAADRIAAAAVIADEAPPESLRSLNSLVTLVEKARSTGGKRNAAKAIDALASLMTGQHAIPSNRKLRRFKEQRLGNLKEGKEKERTRKRNKYAPQANSNAGKADKSRLLALYSFEDELKKMHERAVAALEALTKDPLGALRRRAMGAAASMLSGKPENEHALLQMLINKLGDPTKKTSAKASEQLKRVMESQPRMKAVVADYVLSSIHRPRQKREAKLTCVRFLASIRYTKGDERLAGKMLKAFLSEFNTEEGERTASMASSLLIGVRRCMRFCEKESVRIALAEKEPRLLKLARSGSPRCALQSLQLLWGLVSGQDARSDASALDRFYTALYDSLLSSARLLSSPQASPYLALVFKAVRADTASAARQCAFARRLMQTSMSAPSNVSCASLLVVSELAGSCQSVARMLSLCRRGGVEKEGEGVGDEGEGAVNEGEWPSKGGYSMKKRNPVFSNAEKEAPWELCVLRRSFHPSLVAFTNGLLGAQAQNGREEGLIKYKGDPVVDLALTNFLDKFLKRQPKMKANRNKVPARGNGEGEDEGEGEGEGEEDRFMRLFHDGNQASYRAKRDVDKEEGSEDEVDELMQKMEEEGDEDNGMDLGSGELVDDVNDDAEEEETAEEDAGVEGGRSPFSFDVPEVGEEFEGGVEGTLDEVMAQENKTKRQREKPAKANGERKKKRKM